MGKYFFANVVLFVAGVGVLIRLRKKYAGINRWDLIFVIFLLAVLVLLFTEDVVSIIKAFVEQELL